MKGNEMDIVGVVIAVLFFAAVIIAFVSWVAVQQGHRAVEMQQDFTKQLVAGLGVAGGHHLADKTIRQVIDTDGRSANERYQRDNQQQRPVPPDFPQRTGTGA